MLNEFIFNWQKKTSILSASFKADFKKWAETYKATMIGFEFYDLLDESHCWYCTQEKCESTAQCMVESYDQCFTDVSIPASSVVDSSSYRATWFLSNPIRIESIEQVEELLNTAIRTVGVEIKYRPRFRPILVSQWELINLENDKN